MNWAAYLAVAVAAAAWCWPLSLFTILFTITIHYTLYTIHYTLLYSLYILYDSFLPQDSLPQELGIPYEILSASEMNPAYRAFMQLNYKIPHMYEDFEEQVSEHKCLYHRTFTAECLRGSKADLAVLGTPCHRSAVQGRNGTEMVQWKAIITQCNFPNCISVLGCGEHSSGDSRTSWRLYSSVQHHRWDDPQRKASWGGSLSCWFQILAASC
mgnify:CR=1 FL=1